MFNPKQAKEDNYFLGIGFCVIVMVIAVFLANNSFNTGGRYLLLKNFGVMAKGVVFGVYKNKPDGDVIKIYPMFKDTKFWGKIKIVGIEFTPVDQRTETFFLMRPLNEDILKINSTLDILHLQSNPKISSPQVIIEEYAFDSKLLMFSLFVLVCAMLVTGLLFQRWRKFKKAMIHY